MKKTIYIAGPMRGIPHFNHPAFFEAERMLLKDGEYEVVNPARMDKESEEEFEPRTALNRDLSAICERCTAIYMLRGWQKSAGAMSEYNLAKCLDLELYYQEGYNEETPLKLDGYSEALLGVVERFNTEFLLYDKGKIIEHLIKEGEMEEEDAEEYFNFNMLGSWVGDGTPAYLIIKESKCCDMGYACSCGDEVQTICSSCFIVAKKAIDRFVEVAKESLARQVEFIRLKVEAEGMRDWFKDNKQKIDKMVDEECPPPKRK